MTKGRTTTAAERMEIARACIAGGNNYGEIAQKYQVSYQQVYTWTKKYRAMGETGLEDRRKIFAFNFDIASIERKLYIIRHKNGVLSPSHRPSATSPGAIICRLRPPPKPHSR